MLDKFIPHPTVEYLVISKYILIVLLSIVVPYMGIIIGSLTYSLYFNIFGKAREHYLEFAGDLMEINPINPIFGIFLIIIPFVAGTIIYNVILYSSNIISPFFIGISTLLIVIGLLFLYIYKYTIKQRQSILFLNIAAGISSLLFFLVGYFIFLSSNELLLEPSMWQSTHLFISGNLILRYLMFLTGAFAITGGSIFFFFFYRSGNQKQFSPEYGNFIKNFIVKVTIIFVIFQALFGILFLITLPQAAISSDMVGPQALILLLSYALCIMLYKHDLKFEVPIFAVFLIIFLIMGINDYIIRETAIEPHTKILVTKALLEKQKLTGETPADSGIDGKLVFERNCYSCHSYDKKMMGPTFGEVIPEYSGKLDELKEFIRNPKKMDPSYPPMPKLGLKEEEISAVANYLLNDYLKEHK